MCRVFIGFTFLFFLSCDTNKPLDREAIKEEMKNREVKRVTDAEIMEKANEVGTLIWQALPLQDSTVSEFLSKFDVEIDTLLWSDNPFTSQEKDILEAYQYAMENKLPTDPGIQGGNDKVLFFCAPYIEDESIEGVIFIKILKKDIVLAI